jgi:hypothetical protein
MNQYLIELYTPNSTWKGLSSDERTQYLNNVGAAMGQLTEQGVKALTLTQIDAQIDQSSEHQFLGVWYFPNQEARDALLAGIKASGWYDYFDHVNAAGKEGSFSEHLEALSKI